MRGLVRAAVLLRRARRGACAAVPHTLAPSLSLSAAGTPCRNDLDLQGQGHEQRWFDPHADAAAGAEGPTRRRRRRGLQGDADRKKVLYFGAVGAEAGGSQPDASGAGTCWKNRPKQAGPSKVMCCGGSIRPTAATRWVVADSRKRAARRGARWLRGPRHTPGPAISDTSSCASLATLVARACADRPTRRRQRKTARRQRSRLRLRLQRQIPRRSLRLSSFIFSAIHLASSCFSLWAISLWAMAIISVGGRLRAQRHVKNPKATVPRPKIATSTMKPSASSHPPSF